MKTNLIGISGKIGSGKDATGKILQIINRMPHFDNGAVVKFLERPIPDSEFKIKKYADKLKEIVCLLIGCTREQLEDREFKEKELGEEWWYYTDTLFNNKDKKLVSYLEASSSLHNDLNWYIIKLTPRKLLQLLGTEAGRQIIHPNIWVNALFADYKGIDNPLEKGHPEEWGKPNWIITDVRFPNEAQAIENRGGIVIRVNRGYALENEFDERTRMDNEHPSETALDDYEFDHVIENNGSLEDLVEKVKQLKL